MKLDEIIKEVSIACEFTGIKPSYDAILETATKIFLSDKNIFITNEKDKVEEMRKAFEGYDKHLLDSSESYHDYNLKKMVLDYIKAYFDSIFKSWQ